MKVHKLFYRYKKSEDARMALEQMEGFELAGRQVGCLSSASLLRAYSLKWQLRVNTVHEKGTTKYTPADTLDEAGGGWTS